MQLSQPVNAYHSSVVLKSPEEQLELAHVGWETKSGLMAFRPIE